MKKINIISPFDKSLNFELNWNPSTFKPTATSNFLIKAICSSLKKPVENLLDLGCGIGVVGICLMKHKIAKNLFASDLSSEAVTLTKKNCIHNNIVVDCRTSDVFNSWKNYKFDVIADDISGIAQEISEISNWFNNVPSNSGSDGTRNTVLVIKAAKNFLKSNGALYFPVISLSNTKKILKIARGEFDTVTKISSNSWFLPDEMMKYIDFIKLQAYKGNIHFEQKFGKIICYTDIYEAKNTKKINAKL